MSDDIETRLQQLESKAGITNMALQYLLRALREHEINIDPQLRYFKERVEQDAITALRNENTALFISLSDVSCLLNDFLDGESTTTSGTPIRA